MDLGRSEIAQVHFGFNATEMHQFDVDGLMMRGSLMNVSLIHFLTLGSKLAKGWK